jgi:CheY-like chemotaxis protein
MTAFRRKRALIVEDEAVVAIMIEEMLRDLGCEVVGMAGRLPQAVEKARELALDFGVLDVNLGGDMTYEVADALIERGIPFIFATGYGSAVIPGQYAAMPVIQKPFAPVALEEALERLMTLDLTAGGASVPADTGMTGSG